MTGPVRTHLPMFYSCAAALPLTLARDSHAGSQHGQQSIPDQGKGLNLALPLTNGNPTLSQPDAWAEVHLISACACGNQIGKQGGAMSAILTPCACSPTLDFLCIPLSASRIHSQYCLGCDQAFLVNHGFQKDLVDALLYAC